MSRSLARPVLGLVAGLALLATGCAPADEATSPAPQAGGATTSAGATTGGSSPTADECAKDSLKTINPGKLTIATDQPVYEPWFVDDEPENGKGFEGAIAKALAEEMGYSDDEVTWVRVKFDTAISPGPKKFDFDINEFSITQKRKKAVDFSSPYYDVTQAVITTEGSKAASAKSLADLEGLKLGAQVGTTSLDAIESAVAPSQKPAVYNNNDDAKRALENGQVDAIVVDLPTAFYITAAELEKGKIVGQLPASGGQPEQFGLVLDKGSPLTTCVSKAVDALKEDGTLEKIEDEWLSQAGNAPVLQ